MRTAPTRIDPKTGDGTVTLDLGDALELSQVLDYLADWLTAASEHALADLRRFAGDPNAAKTVRRRLSDFSLLLVTWQGDDTDTDTDTGADRDRPW